MAQLNMLSINKVQNSPPRLDFLAQENDADLQTNIPVDLNEPAAFKVCRICLLMEKEMYSISMHGLGAMYEQLTGDVNCTEDKLPQALCGKCVDALSSAHSLREMALRTRELLLYKFDISRHTITVGDIQPISIEMNEFRSLQKGALKSEINHDKNCKKDQDDWMNFNEVGVTSAEVLVNDAGLAEVIINENHDFSFEYAFDNDAGVDENNDKIDKCKTEAEQTRKARSAVVKRSRKTVPGVRNLKKSSKQRSSKQLAANAQSVKDETNSPTNENAIEVKIEDKNNIGNHTNPTNSIEDLKNDVKGEIKNITGSTTATTSADLKNRFTCDSCGQSYRFKSCLARHIMNHPKHFKCTECEYTTTKKRNYDAHIAKKHGIRTYVNCTYCSFKTYTKRSLALHVNIKHTQSIVYNCAYCSYKTYGRSSLVYHTNSKHTKASSFTCTYCDYVTYKKAQLNKHINIRHTNSESFMCPYCGYITYCKSTLNKHINTIHTKAKSYNCTFCTYKAYTSKALRIHINVKHTKSMLYTCSYCSYKSYRQSCVRKHMNAKHSNCTLYNCAYCSYKTCYKTNLEIHVNGKHTMSNYFDCAYCPFKTYYKSDLTKHIKVKHG